MSQLVELNNLLGKHPSPIIASELGLAGAKILGGEPGSGLPGSAVLDRLGWEGDPDYPYIRGHFGINGHDASLVVELHTAALRELSRRLGVRQLWGI
jgi:hypothetical protein